MLRVLELPWLPQRLQRPLENRTCLHAPEIAHSYTTSRELLGFNTAVYLTVFVRTDHSIRGLWRSHASRIPERNFAKRTSSSKRAQVGNTLPSKSLVGASMKPPHAASHAFPSVFAMWIWVFHTLTAADSTTVANRRLDADTCTLAESHRSRSRRYARRSLMSSLERTALCCKTYRADGSESSLTWSETPRMRTQRSTRRLE